MIDLFTILTKGGIVLWSKSFTKVSNNPIDSLIKDVLINERGDSNSYIKNEYELKWKFSNETNLIFVVVYQKIIQLTYADELLSATQKAFMKKYPEEVQNPLDFDEFEFDDEFTNLLTKIEMKDNENKVQRSFKDTEAYLSTREGSQKKLSGKNDESSSEEEMPSPTFAPRSPRGRKSPKFTKKTKTKTPKSPKSPKRIRKWEGQVTAEEAEALDFSKKDENERSISAEHLVDREAMGQRNKDGVYDVDEMQEESDESDEFDENSEKQPTGKVYNFFKSITGQKVITEEDLDPILVSMKEHLINKNVAADIAAHLCNSVSKGLIGKKAGGWKGVSNLVKLEMEKALKSILTPRTSTDVLRDIFAAKKKGRPYSIVFVGVNGVGKSTNLSKVCFWLLQNKLRVLIAACDTFRSGAVEQLRVHARNLRALEENAEVDLFERGYGKDSAAIAKDAINYAALNKYDVVLIDTAGRMQDNEPLMRALAKLVTVNDPDKIIFVGEALVGNEAVDQLTKFNQALKDFSGRQNPRQIDGIILTKFDTIDDKVGAALSMTYITGQPILFVGTGQTYTDLRKMNVKSIVQSLLK
ncbi:SRP54-domain-containing protein [Anaeromyces robustus]|uniref:SRP54-domain-containing protein n=1 Tax=Anaeromyces robustus TaxID=1754192 RepID=A0A1Y1XKR0_9FUNG|nr:SRP54-domain-containing protein [Anaeromyces robustus]|eukprot:ORX86295.1 SRP54-domain-containing protein [Anaeromyces robustus]